MCCLLHLSTSLDRFPGRTLSSLFYQTYHEITVSSPPHSPTATFPHSLFFLLRWLWVYLTCYSPTAVLTLLNHAGRFLLLTVGALPGCAVYDADAGPLMMQSVRDAFTYMSIMTPALFHALSSCLEEVLMGLGRA